MLQEGQTIMFRQFGVAAIAIYGLLKSFFPDAAYISVILFSHPKHFTTTEVTQDMSNLLAYSKLIFTFVAFLVTDVLQYKTVIVIGSAASLASELILYFGTTNSQIQIMHILEGVFKASSVAYRTYIYTQVKKQSYHHMTAVVYIMPKVGILISALLAQILLLADIVDLYSLIVMTIVAKMLSLLTALTLPSVKGTVYSAGTTTLKNNEEKGSKENKQAINLLWDEFKFALSNAKTVQLSIWWIISQGAFYLVTSYYVQALWNEATGKKLNVYNAAVDAVYASCSTIGCFIVGKLTVDWEKYRDGFIAIGTLIEGVCLIVSAHSSSLLISYSLYIVGSTLYDVMFVIISSQVALQVKNESFGLIFGINTFLAFGFQALLTYVLTSKNTLALPIREQFTVAGCCYGVLGLAFLVKTFHKACSFCFSSASYKIDDPPKTNVEVVKTISSVVGSLNDN